jgi:adenylate kinase family enzyme
MPTANAGGRTTIQRVVIVGTTGSGKTTFAAHLAGRLGVPHVELDALHWEANWTEADLDRFRVRVERAVSQEAWVVDGNYHVVRDLVWPRAEAVVWLDFRLSVILWRLVRRTARRVFTREELWNGNRERFLTQVATRDSILLWALRTYRRRRRNYPPLFNRPEHAHLAVVRLRSPRAAQRWLADAAQGNPTGAQIGS